jgi:hypothetical protein
MRFFEIAPGENQDIDIGDDISPIIKMLRRDCSEVIAAMQKYGNFLYRGMSGDDLPLAFLSRPQEDRKSQNHNTDNNNKFDAIAAKAGFKALRSNSIFCITDVTATLLYGKPYIVLPKNGYAVTWSPLVFVFKEDVNPADLDKPGFLQKYEFQDSNLDDAMESENEILIRGEYYTFAANEYEEQLRSALFGDI